MDVGLLAVKLREKLPAALATLNEMRDLVGSTSGSSVGVWDNREYGSKLGEAGGDGGAEGAEEEVSSLASPAPLVPDSYFEKYGISRQQLLEAIAVAKAFVEFADSNPELKKYVDLLRRDR